jgi:hypothetical protein
MKSLIRICGCGLFVLLWVLAFVPTAFGQTTVYLPNPNVGFCNITGVSTASPAVITYNGNCAIVNDDIILIDGVIGATAINIRLDTPTDLNNLYRVVKNRTSTTFTVTDGGGTAINGTVHGSCAGAASTHAGNCAYVEGGYFAKASSYTLRDHPRGLFDGPGGTETVRLLTGGAGADVTANFTRAQMRAHCTARKALANQFARGMGTYGTSGALACAMVWKLDGDTAARDVALYDLRNPEQLNYGSGSCDSTLAWCGGSVSSVGDYPMHYGRTFDYAYTLMQDLLTTPEKQRIIDVFYSDYAWPKGGSSPLSTATVTGPLAWRIASPGVGTYSDAGGSATITGSGTSWSGVVQVGDLFFSDVTDYAVSRKVTAVAGEVLTLEYGFGSAHSGSAYYIARPFNTVTNGGLIFLSKHYPIGQWGGGNGHQYRKAFGIPAGGDGYPSPYYGGISAQSHLYNSIDGNANLMQVYGRAIKGLTYANVDNQAKLDFSRAELAFVTQALPFQLGTWGGPNGMASVYNFERGWEPALEHAEVLKRSVISYPDPYPTSFYTNALKTVMATKLPGSNMMQTLFENGNLGFSGRQLWGTGVALSRNPTSSLALQTNGFLLGELNIDGAGNDGAPFISDDQWTAPLWYMLYNHTTGSTTPTDLTWSLVPDVATCVARFSAAECSTYFRDERKMLISRTTQNTTATYWSVDYSGFACRDHCAGGLGGWQSLTIGNVPLISGDSYSGFGTYRRGQAGYIVPPPLHAGVDLLSGDPNLATLWYPSWAGFQSLSGGNNNYAYARMERSPSYAAAANITSAITDHAHFKKASEQDYIIQRSTVVNTSAQDVHQVEQMALYDTLGSLTQTCGTPTSNTCVTLSSSSKTVSNVKGTKRLNVVPIGFSHGIRLATPSGTDSNGSYTNGVGYTFQYYICPSGDGGSTCVSATNQEWFTVFEPSNSASTGFPTVATFGTAGNWHGVLVTSAAGGIRKALAVHDATMTPVQTSASFTLASGPAQVVVAGLVAGTYTLSSGGTPVCSSVVVSAGDNSLECSAVSAGAITVAVNGGTVTRHQGTVRATGKAQLK